MRAVNLIPSDDRRRGAGGTGSGIAAYIALGALAALLLMSAAFALTTRSVNDKRDKLAELEVQAKAAEDRLNALAAYTRIGDVRRRRTESVTSLVKSRFDWGHTLHELSRTLPKNAWLTSLRATVDPSSQVDGGTTDPLRSQGTGPALEIVGCTTSQEAVPSVIAAMRRIDGVSRVSLSSALKSEQVATSSGSSASTGAISGDCRQGSERFPQFSMTVFLTPPAGAEAPAGSTAGTTP